MSLRDKWYSSGRLRLLGALLLNALFLAVLLAFLEPVFDSNDDLALSAFVDGQMAEKCARIPFFNYALGLLLKAVYTALGDGSPWYVMAHYGLLLSGFTAIAWVFLERLRLWQGMLLSFVMLALFGVNAYLSVNFTKTASVATVGGLLLMLHAMEDREKGRRALSLAIGMILTIFGFMYRIMEFLPCGALMAALGLRGLYGITAEEGGERKLRRSLIYISPFLLLLVLIGGLYALNRLAWSQGGWWEYLQFNDIRADLADYGIPFFNSAMRESYEAAGLTESAVNILMSWNFFDPEVFTTGDFTELAAARDAIYHSTSLRGCGGIFFKTCIPGFFRYLPVYGLLIMVLLWLFSGRHKGGDWLGVAAVAVMFGGLYLYLIMKGRYLMNRVDGGLFLAMFAVMGFTLDKESLDRRKALCGIMLAASVFTSAWYVASGSYDTTGTSPEERQSAKETIELLLEDNDCLYLCEALSQNDVLHKEKTYRPLETVQARYMDRLTALGGWTMNHPAIMASLARYGVENPYRDMVNNEKVYVIFDNIDLVISYIHDYYDQDAYAERVEPLSSQTGLNIYRILS